MRWKRTAAGVKRRFFKRFPYACPLLHALHCRSNKQCQCFQRSVLFELIARNSTFLTCVAGGKLIAEMMHCLPALTRLHIVDCGIGIDACDALSAVRPCMTRRPDPNDVCGTLLLQWSWLSDFNACSVLRKFYLPAKVLKSNGICCLCWSTITWGNGLSLHAWRNPDGSSYVIGIVEWYRYLWPKTYRTIIIGLLQTSDLRFLFSECFEVAETLGCQVSWKCSDLYLSMFEFVIVEQFHTDKQCHLPLALFAL